MGTCTRCDSLLHDEHLPPPGTTYNVGDIIALLESVHVPVHDHIFNQEPVPHRRGSTASALSSNSQICGKLRPAIVLERRLREWQAEHGAEETVVLLFATYEGDFRVRRLLPSILQLFCVAVYPHSEIVEDPDAFHLHTSPEWSNSKKDSTDLHAWLIARQFTSRGQTSDRWKNANRTRQNSHSSFIVDQETRERLLEIIEEKWDQWEALCDEDPSYPKTCRREYQEFKRRSFPHSGSTTPARTPGTLSPSTSPISLPPSGARNSEVAWDPPSAFQNLALHPPESNNKTPIGNGPNSTDPPSRAQTISDRSRERGGRRGRRGRNRGKGRNDVSTPALVLNVSQPWHNESTEAGVSQPVIPNCAPSQPHPTMVAERTSKDENPTDALAEPVHAQLAADARNPSTVVLAPKQQATQARLKLSFAEIAKQKKYGV